MCTEWRCDKCGGLSMREKNLQNISEYLVVPKEFCTFVHPNWMNDELLRELFCYSE